MSEEKIEVTPEVRSNAKVRVCVRTKDNADFIFHENLAKRNDFRVEDWTFDAEGKVTKKTIVGGFVKEEKPDTSELDAKIIAQQEEINRLRAELSRKLETKAGGVAEPSGDEWKYNFDPDWTKNELIEYASGKFGIDLDKTMKKSDLVDKIKEVEDELRP